MESLWGKMTIEKVETPAKILEGQSKYLEEMTFGYAYAELRGNKKVEPSELGEFKFDYLIRGKFLEDYSFRLFQIVHEVDIYPIYMLIDEELYMEIKEDFIHLPGVDSSNNFEENAEVWVNNREIFIGLLRLILSSKRVQNIITGIFSISDDYC